MKATLRFGSCIALSVTLAALPAAAEDRVPGACPARRSACSAIGGMRLSLRLTSGQHLTARGQGQLIDLADPLLSTTFGICIFGSDDDLLYGGELPPGSRWKPIRGGFVYRDSTGAVHDGIKMFKIKTARGGVAFSLKGGGPALDLGDLPAGLPVTFQIWTTNNDNGHVDACLDGTFDEAPRNDQSGFSTRR